MLIYHFTDAGRLPWIMQSGFWERRYGTRTTHGVGGDEEAPDARRQEVWKDRWTPICETSRVGHDSASENCAEQPV